MHTNTSTRPFSTRILWTSLGLLALGANAQAQDFGYEVTRQAPPDTPQNFQEETPNTGTVDRGLVNGIARGGLTMLSPVAPAYYGDGRAYVSTYARAETKTNAYNGKDETGEPKGLKFFSYEW